MMTTEFYSQKKEELIGILADILKVDNLPVYQRESFENSRKKLQEDEFSIALIGEFQGGKSTTFDALCGGREISPRGNNMKTSACRIKVTNISDESPEKAIITWKTNAELVLTISSLLSSIDEREIGYRKEDKKAFSLVDYLNLNDPKHMNIVRNLINEEWDNVAANDTDKRDILLIAEFILHFYNATKEERNRTEYALKDVSQMMTFPQNMVTRFKQNGISAFSKEEALFAFVQSIHCHIKSNTLERLGCTVTDCPGLFASEYDTSIATQTIADSDATLYLLSGEKAMSQGDKRAIAEIARIKRAGLIKGDNDYNTILDNIFFAINQRKSDNETSFVEDNLTEINSLGYNKPSLSKFNALLYYYAVFGMNYLKNKLDDKTIDGFLQSGERYGNTIEKIWVKSVKRILVTVDVDYDVESLSDDSVNHLFELCGAKELFGEIEEFIINRKAYSILIENGAKKVNKGLVAIEEELKRIEKAATEDVLEKAKEYKKAVDDFNLFKSEVENLLKNSFSSDTVIKPLVDEVYTRYFRNPQLIEDVSFSVTKDLIKYIGKASTRWKGIKSMVGTVFSEELEERTEKQIRTDIEPFFANAFRTCLAPILKTWGINMKNGSDISYQRYFVRELKHVSEQIYDLWNISTTSSPMLRTILINTAPLEPGIMEVEKLDYKRQMSSKTTFEIATISIEETMSDLLDVIIGYIITWIVAFMLDVAISGGLALLIAALGKLLASLFKGERVINSKTDFNKKELNLYHTIYSLLTQALSDYDNQERICYGDDGKSLIAVPNSIVKGYRDFYESELKVKEDELKKKIESEKDKFSGTKEHLRKISESAKKQREEEIAPLRERVQNLIDSVGE